MGKFEGVLLMSDFDGTLAYKGSVSRENCEAIRYFQSEGGLFALSSGRPPQLLAKWKDFFVPNTWSALLNGAVLYDYERDRTLFRGPVDADFYDLLLAVMRACPRYEAVHIFWEAHHETFPNGEGLDRALFSGQPIYKAVFHIPEACSDDYIERVRSIAGDRYIAIRSWVTGLEIQKRGTGKDDAVRRLKKELGDLARLTVAVGDYENDLEMIRAADIGYAVGNAMPAVKAVADRITVPCGEHAIAHIIAELEQELKTKSIEI